MPSKTQKTTSEATKPTKPERRWHFDKEKFAFVVFLLAWVALSFTASQIVIAYPMQMLLGENVTKPLWTLVYSILQYTLTIVLVIWLPPRLWRQAKARHRAAEDDSKTTAQAEAAAEEKLLNAPISTKNNPLATDRNEMGMGEFPTFVDIGLAPIGYVAYAILANVLTAAMSVFEWFNKNQAQDVGFGYFITTGDRVMAMIALVLVAPIAEEILMRGWLYGKLRTKLGAVSATLLVSVLFGALHGQWNVGVATFALSVVMCSLREVTGTIWSGILLHMLSNGIAFYIMYIAI